MADDKVQKGKLIISAAKSLKRCRLDDKGIAALLYATFHAGRAGLFASSLRHNRGMNLGYLSGLAAGEGFNLLDLRSQLIPWVENSGLCQINRDSKKQVVSVDSLVLSYEGLLKAVSDYYDSLSPTPEDLGCLLTLEICCQLPTPEPDVLHVVALHIGEEKAKAAVSLAKGYKVVASREGRGLRYPVLYSERLWSHCIERASEALSPLTKEQREIVLNFVEQVKAYQGYPESLIRNYARQNNAEPMLDLAIGVNLLNKTKIQMADGSSRVFLTTPHFYSDLASEFGEDMCDRVKIFLDSTRNGQHFGYIGTGRILDPDLLLSKLINRGVIGPCTAIGTDWVTSERAGIVKVNRISPTSGKCYMHLVQKDTVAKVHQIITKGMLETSPTAMSAANIREGTNFVSTEQLRAEAGELPGDLGEAERAIIMKLRES